MIFAFAKEISGGFKIDPLFFNNGRLTSADPGLTLSNTGTDEYTLVLDFPLRGQGAPEEKRRVIDCVVHENGKSFGCIESAYSKEEKNDVAGFNERYGTIPFLNAAIKAVQKEIDSRVSRSSAESNVAPLGVAPSSVDPEDRGKFETLSKALSIVRGPSQRASSAARRWIEEEIFAITSGRGSEKGAFPQANAPLSLDETEEDKLETLRATLKIMKSIQPRGGFPVVSPDAFPPGS